MADFALQTTFSEYISAIAKVQSYLDSNSKGIKRVELISEGSLETPFSYCEYHFYNHKDLEVDPGRFRNATILESCYQWYISCSTGLLQIEPGWSVLDISGHYVISIESQSAHLKWRFYRDTNEEREVRVFEEDLTI